VVTRTAVALFAILICAVAKSIAQQPPAAHSAQPSAQQSRIEDLSRGATFKFKIAPDLPEFTFKVVPEAPDPGESPTVREVQVFRGDSGELMQTLEGCEFSEMEAPAKGADWFRAQDINFDGHRDLFLRTMWGATGNEFGCVWLYQPQKGRFQFSQEFSALGGFRLDPATKTITTHSNGGMAGTVFSAAKYVVENNLPVAVVSVAQDFDSASEKYHCVVKRRPRCGAALRIVRDISAASNGDLAGPCDAGDPFRGISYE